jgi:hypothetical protein
LSISYHYSTWISSIFLGNSEKIWKIQKKSKLNNEKNRENMEER